MKRAVEITCCSASAVTPLAFGDRVHRAKDRDLRGVEAGNEAKRQEGPIVRTQGPEGARQIEGGNGVRGIAAAAVGDGRDIDDDPVAAAAQDLASLVGRDRDQPGPDAAVIAKSPEASPSGGP